MRAMRVLVVVLAATCVAGCISLFPKTKPSQEYDLGAAAPPPAAASAAAPFTVALANTDFVRDAAGERILTVSGDQTAYIDGARWVSPAYALFDDALRRGFEIGPARLLARGEPTHADYSLTLDVRSFEARYGSDPTAPPTVRIEVYAALGKASEPTDRDRIFVGEVRASDNRVSAIVAAFDAALAKVIGQLVPWVDARGEG